MLIQNFKTYFRNLFLALFIAGNVMQSHFAMGKELHDDSFYWMSGKNIISFLEYGHHYFATTREGNILIWDKKEKDPKVVSMPSPSDFFITEIATLKNRDQIILLNNKTQTIVYNLTKNVFVNVFEDKIDTHSQSAHIEGDQIVIKNRKRWYTFDIETSYLREIKDEILNSDAMVLFFKNKKGQMALLDNKIFMLSDIAKGEFDHPFFELPIDQRESVSQGHIGKIINNQIVEIKNGYSLSYFDLIQNKFLGKKIHFDDKKYRQTIGLVDFNNGSLVILEHRLASAPTFESANELEYIDLNSGKILRRTTPIDAFNRYKANIIFDSATGHHFSLENGHHFSLEKNYNSYNVVDLNLLHQNRLDEAVVVENMIKDVVADAVPVTAEDGRIFIFIYNENNSGSFVKTSYSLIDLLHPDSEEKFDLLLDNKSTLWTLRDATMPFAYFSDYLTTIIEPRTSFLDFSMEFLLFSRVTIQ